MELVELAEVSRRDIAELIDGEPHPWGAGGEALQWLEKDRHLALRTPEGRIVAMAGAAVVPVAVAGGEPFDVVGLGGLFITHSQRGRGLMSMLVEPLLSLAREMGLERAMLFCNAELVPLYASAGFQEIEAPV